MLQRKIVAISIILFTLTIGVGTGQISSPHLKKINSILSQNSSELPSGKTEFNDCGDSICLTVHYQSPLHLSISLSIISAICQYPSAKPGFAFYISGETGTAPSPMYFETSKTTDVNEILHQFRMYFESKNLTAPSNSLPEFENDLMAIKVEGHRLNDGNIWGIDSVFSGPIVLRYTDNTVRLERNVKNGVLQGSQKNYYPNGQLAYSKNFDNGLATGQFLYYDVKGNLVKQENYKNGLLHGATTEWWSNNKKKSERIYNQGKLKKETVFDLLSSKP